jgi:short-subunit dehydrogenase
MSSYACITGATGGVGKAFAAECAERGWNLYLTDIAAGLLPPLATGLHRLFGVEIEFHACDLTDAEARQDFWIEANRRGACFHTLVNVAGVEYEGFFKQRSRQELMHILRLNVEATVDMTHAVLRYRDPSQPLRIINMSSLGAFYPMPTKAVYAASKRFLLEFSQALNYELRGENVHVSAVCPAGLPTYKEAIERLLAQGLAGQLTTQNVGEVAQGAIDYVLAGKAVFVPGAVNRLLAPLGRLLPTAWVVGIIGRRWMKTNTLSKS